MEEGGVWVEIVKKSDLFTLESITQNCPQTGTRTVSFTFPLQSTWRRRTTLKELKEEVQRRD